jgi:predicted nucleotidyltransferase component of viral defense system
MIDINRHRFYLVQILKDLYTDLELANCLGFKGGSALMFFYDLPRFSIDLDFNLLDPDKEDLVFRAVGKILRKYGKIHDKARKFFGPLIVLDYGVDDRKLKVEISNRVSEDTYEIKNLLGINVKVMVQEDMFAHKLCALLDRDTMANRDLFDCWFFLQRQTPVNKQLIEYRMAMPFTEYLQTCIEHIENMGDRGLLQGMGELLDNDMKRFVRSKLRGEVIHLLKLYITYPLT